MKVYKLTDQKFQTHGNTQWGVNVTHRASGDGDLCGPGWLHFYYSPELAALLNFIHADIADPVLWECSTGRILKDDRGLKGGTTKLTTIRRVALPVFTPNQRAAFGIYCALEVCKTLSFVTWANNWLSGQDRSEKSATWAARAAAEAAAAARAAEAEAVARAAAEAAAAAAAAAAARAWAADFSFLQRAAEKALKIT